MNIFYIAKKKKKKKKTELVKYISFFQLEHNNI